MKPNKQNMSYKQKVFLESLENLIKASSGIGLDRNRSTNVKDMLNLAKNMVKLNKNG